MGGHLGVCGGEVVIRCMAQSAKSVQVVSSIMADGVLLNHLRAQNLNHMV